MTFQEIREYVRQMVGRVIRFTTTTKNSADGQSDQVAGRKSDANDPDTGYSVRRLWPFGIRSLPPAGVDALMLMANGGPTNGVMIGAESSKYGPSNLQDGEVAIYNSVTDCMILLDKTGKITSKTPGGQDYVIASGNKVTIDAASGQDIILNGGALKVARETDALSPGTIAGQAGPYPVIFTYTPNISGGGETVVPGSPAAGQLVTLAGVIAPGGAAHVKA